MITRTKWTGRKFKFDIPEGNFPAIIERLKGTPARMEELIRSFPPEILKTRVDESWSIQENATHLSDLETLHEKRLDEFIEGAEVLSPADMENRKTHEANHNERDAEDVLKEFRRLRMNFVKRLEGLDDQLISQVALHPRLKEPMRVVDMAIFVAEHDDHHLSRMTKISKILKTRLA